jgi:hypothetical protein
MNREVHVRFWEGLLVRFRWATQLSRFYIYIVSISAFSDKARPMRRCRLRRDESTQSRDARPPSVLPPFEFFFFHLGLCH